MAILIKRYANRKLYNTQTSRYITLKGIAELLDAGEEVRVIDNESGEDITSVALSQILVDSKRSNTSPPEHLLSQILGKGGDVLYGALRRSVDDATEGIGGFQQRVRRMVGVEGHRDETEQPAREREPTRPAGGRHNPALAEAEGLVQNAMERVFKLLDLPSRSDIDALNRNLERVAEAVESLEKVWARHEPAEPRPPQSASGE